MAKIAETYIHIKVDVTKETLDKFKEYLKYTAKNAAKEHFGFEVKIEAVVEEGSIKVWLKVAGCIYIGIAEYGSLRSGIEHIINDSRAFSEYVIERVHVETDLPDEAYYRTERRLGVPGRIQRLYPKLDELSQQIESNDTNAVEKTFESIYQSLDHIMRDLDSPEDRKLFIETVPENIRPRMPDPSPEPGIDEHFAMTVLREEKLSPKIINPRNIEYSFEPPKSLDESMVTLRLTHTKESEKNRP